MYGQVLPSRLYLEFSCCHAWNGFYVRGSNYIEKVEKMMMFYGCKPYGVLLLHYTGGAFFRVEIFNECAVEISYPLACYEKHSFVRTRQRSPVEVMNKLQFSDVELDKLRSTFSYNAKRNFVGLHELIISEEDLKLSHRYEVE